MKIAASRHVLLEGLQPAASIAPQRSTRPILTGIRLTADAKECRAFATDLDLSVSSRLREVVVEAPGDLVFPAQILMEMLRSIEGQEVTISSKGRNAEIRSSDVRYSVVTQEPDEFPEIAVVGPSGLTVPRAFLEEMFSRTSFAAARDVGRYAINGVLLEFADGTLRMVATDGRRLALAHRPLPEGKLIARRAILPNRALQECLRSTSGDSSIQLVIDDKHVVFAGEYVQIAAKPLEGDFPDYAAVIPSGFRGKAVVERDALQAAIRKTSVMSGDDMRSTRLELKAGKLALSAQCEGRGTAQTQVDAEHDPAQEYSGDFNPEFLADYLKPLPSQKLEFHFQDGTAPAMFTLAGTEDSYIVMPITTS